MDSAIFSQTAKTQEGTRLKTLEFVFCFFIIFDRMLGMTIGRPVDETWKQQCHGWCSLIETDDNDGCLECASIPSSLWLPQNLTCSHVHQRCAESLCDDMIQRSALSHRIQLRKQKALLGLRQLADEVECRACKALRLVFHRCRQGQSHHKFPVVMCVTYMMLF